MNIKINFFILILPLLFTTNSLAQDFIVRFDLEDKKHASSLRYYEMYFFNQHNLSGLSDIKEIFIKTTKTDGKIMKSISLIVEAKNIEETYRKLSNLPFSIDRVIDTSKIQPLGRRWIIKENHQNVTTTLNHYNINLPWGAGVTPEEVGNVLSLDLQRVVSLIDAGEITSSHINKQELSPGLIMPTLSLNVLSESLDSAVELIESFKSVSLKYVEVDIIELGEKINKNHACNIIHYTS